MEVSICSQGTIGLLDYSPVLSTISSGTNNLCNAGLSGSAVISANGGYVGPFGSPCKDYNLTWNGPTLPPSGVDLNCHAERGASNYTMTNLSSGEYTVVVKDIMVVLLF